MALLVVGSIAFDTLETPYGRADRILGGAATYFSLAARFFTEVRVVGVVGDDFGAEHEDVFREQGICTAGIERAQGKTFHWAARYSSNLSERTTLATELNVFETFRPRIPEQYLTSEFVFLANIQPTLQREVRQHVSGARLTGLDTMNYWIQRTPDSLAGVLREIDILLINDDETRELGSDHSLSRAARRVLAKGPKALVVKHGEYGATIFFGEGAFGIGKHPFRAPAMPLEEVRDPTGAGDAFAGGFMGYIASTGELNRETLKRAMFYGSVLGSYAVESFGTERLQSLTREEIDARFQVFRELTHLE
jgi:sugar/nucleoside kinase (ribokinase family)